MENWSACTMYNYVLGKDEQLPIYKITNPSDFCIFSQLNLYRYIHTRYKYYLLIYRYNNATIVEVKLFWWIYILSETLVYASTTTKKNRNRKDATKYP